jgi:hypothetical protein
MADIIIPDYAGDFIKKDGICYYFVEMTAETNTEDNLGIDVFGSCEDCEDNNSSSSDSSSSTINLSTSSEIFTELWSISFRTYTIPDRLTVTHINMPGESVVFDTGLISTGNGYYTTDLEVIPENDYRITVENGCPDGTAWEATVTSDLRGLIYDQSETSGLCGALTPEEVNGFDPFQSSSSSQSDISSDSSSLSSDSSSLSSDSS